MQHEIGFVSRQADLNAGYPFWHTCSCWPTLGWFGLLELAVLQSNGHAADDQLMPRWAGPLESCSNF